jgi:hypothetical protein
MFLILTADHLIFEKKKGYIKARYIELNDELNIINTNDGRSLFSRVTRIGVKIETGFTAPLTGSTTIIVNGIHASCFCDHVLLIGYEK